MNFDTEMQALLQRINQYTTPPYEITYQHEVNDCASAYMSNGINSFSTLRETGEESYTISVSNGVGGNLIFQPISDTKKIIECIEERNTAKQALQAISINLQHSFEN